MENYAEIGVERSTDGLRRRTTFRCPMRKPLRRVTETYGREILLSSTGSVPCRRRWRERGRGRRRRRRFSQCLLRPLDYQSSAATLALRAAGSLTGELAALRPPASAAVTAAVAVENPLTPPVATHLPASPLVVRRDWPSAQPSLPPPPPPPSSSRRSIHRQGQSPRIERFWVYCT